MRRLTRETRLGMTVLAILVVMGLTGSASMATETWWTQWYDRDDPSVTGDWEARVDHGDVCFGGTVLSYEAKTLGGTPASQTGETFFILGLDGLVCRNADQSDGSCLDYKVRYFCKTTEL